MQEIEGISERRTSRLLLAGIILLYVVVVFSQSALKLLWGDELITFYVSQQPGWGGIWHALAAGADPNPPLIHILVQASTAVLGTGATAIRLPAIMCGLVAVLSMWSVLRRWVAPGFAAAGVLAFLSTRGFDYSYDARSYALLTAFALAAFALWVHLPDASGLRRWAMLAGLAACLGLGISSNYYGVLAFFPMAAGEVFRDLRARSVGWGAWLAMLAGALPLFAYLPLIRHNIAEFAPHAWNRPRLSMVGLSYFELVEGVFWPVLLLALFALWKRRKPLRLPRADAVALGVLLLYPFIGFAVALAGAGMISPRCVVPVCCGFGLALALLASHVFGDGDNRRAQRLVLSLFFAWVLAREGFCASQIYEQRQSFLALRDAVAADSNASIFVSDSAFVLPLDYYYRRCFGRAKLVFPIDFTAIHQYEQDDSGEQNLWAGRNGVFPFPVLPMTEIHQLPEQFTVIARPDGWLVRSLQSRGVRFDPPVESSRWYGLGGIFTPMAHPETRLLHAHTVPGSKIFP